ncbi:hypothetical protein pqer_cds_461 [Pandoravirus quercus]|uniref:Uncharacterized protein n=2 Tax=Pandoravirus TaxID=2060084 RepID=A0A2U7U8X0_9VIRU|nr:hypothetical protein pqer_cds_461 [Pandoravirus quercus]AVK74883.1 hypothetical protein pqer_cds_461 [Pandoravirus quercus]QBZ81069.1 hypothetical protein pclt_cds_474 [Pandoravirus celtis]
MKAISTVMERIARAVGLTDTPARTASGAATMLPTTTTMTTPMTMLDELAALWQPMVAVPRAIAIAHDDGVRGGPATARGGDSRASAAWCVIDLDARVLSCETRGLWWDPFDVVPSTEGDRLLLRSAERGRSGSWWCEIVRGPRDRDAERSIYYTDLTFSDTAVEPQRGIINGARLRGGPPKSRTS